MSGTQRRLLVPAYVHPGAEPGPWRALTAAADTLAGVILNPASGPGSEPLLEFLAVADSLRAAGVPLLGYVDTAYGRRPHTVVIEEIERHREWYAVDGVFLDQVADSPALLPHYRRLTVAARACDAAFLALNPGMHPDPGYAELADLLVTFEGTWRSYHELVVPDWTLAHPADRFCHLVYDVPPEHCAHVGETARFRHAGVHYATSGAGANPWGTMMPQLSDGGNQE